MTSFAQLDLLFVVRDMGPLEMIGPIIEQCAQKKLIVEVLAEEPAYGVIRARHHVTPIVCNERTMGDISGYLRTPRPQAVVVGCSSPINFELKFALVAQDLKIPVVVVSDIHGAWKRIPNLAEPRVLVADEKDAAAVRHAGFDASVVGYRQAVLPESSLETEAAVAKMRRVGKRVVLFASSGQPSRFRQELECVLASSAMTPDKHVLVHQPNKKILAQQHPEGGTWGAWIERTLPPGVVRLEGPVVRYADMTISPSSSCMRAAAGGKIGVGLRVRTVEDVLLRETGVTDELNFYENELGMPILREPQSLSRFFNDGPSRVSVQPFDAELALMKIRAFADV